MSLLMQIHLREQPSFKILPIKDAMLGPDKTIPVTLVELSPELKRFHERLVSYLQSLGATFDNPGFIGEHYLPHISIYGQRRVAIGEPIIVNSVSIGHKRTNVDNPPNKIIATIPLP